MDCRPMPHRFTDAIRRQMTEAGREAEAHNKKAYGKDAVQQSFKEEIP